jgi:hypothetical protein
MSATLATRQAVRSAIMSGQLVPAVELLRQQCPGLLGGSAVADEVQFHMSCQQFIELIRWVGVVSGAGHQTLHGTEAEQSCCQHGMK